jgi:hypothetical protein
MRVIRDRPRTVELDEFLARPLFAHLATASEAGARVSPVWFLWEEGVVWVIGSRQANSFLRRIEDDPRCSMDMVDFDRVSGRVHHVGLRGEATVEPFDPERARRLLERYLGPNLETWDGRFQETLHDPHNVLVRFLPETAVARDQSYAATST